MKKRCWSFGLLFLIALLAAVSAVMRKTGGARCDYDGERIQPIYEVDITLKNGSTKRFCSIFCAVSYLREGKEMPKYITVVDEVTAKKIDASIAYFVRSDVITAPHVGNNIHVFSREGDARRHAEQYNGRLVPNPFSLYSRGAH